MSVAVFCKEPTSTRIRAFLQRAADCTGAKPRFLVSDHDPVFDCSTIRGWCGTTTRPRLGAVGQKGSIALVERFFLTLKNEFTRRIFVTLRAGAFRQQARYFIDWYNAHRPHAALNGRTPDEIYDGRQDENLTTRGSVLCISFYKGKRYMPLVTTRKAAA